MPEFLEDLSIPKKFWEDVAKALSCSTCGADLDMSCDVGTATQDEEEEDELWGSWYETYSPRFDDFSKHLESYPYLGLLHSLGKEIAKDINKLSREPLGTAKWFRARQVENSKLLGRDDLFPPDPTAVAIPEGRYNHFGQQVFYLSDTKENAAREILGKAGGLAWVQEFTLSHIVDIANLCKYFIDKSAISELLFGLAYTNVLAKPVERTLGWKPEYFVPRFIADSLRHAGYKGIIFRSPHHYGENLVLLEFNKAEITSTSEPSLVTLPKEEDLPKMFGPPPDVDY